MPWAAAPEYSGVVEAETDLTDTNLIATWLPWLPDWAVAVLYFCAIIAFALALQGVLIRVLGRASEDSGYGLRLIFLRTKKIARFGFVLAAAAFALPLLPLGAEDQALAQRVLVAAFITLLGWTATIATRIGIERYLVRFKIDSADNLLARSAVTQFRVLKRVAVTVIFIITVSLALMMFPSVRQYGISLFASAGIIGVIVGLAAQPTIGNLLAGIQLAVTQPIRIDDVVIVEGEWGRIEEINSTYVVVRIWDLRRLVVPLTYFLEKPFQNWTRSSAKIMGPIYFYLDYRTPVDAIRKKLDEIVKASPDWDGDVVGVQVTDCKETTMEVRALISAADAGKAWNLRCAVREKILAFLQEEYPESLPVQRGELAVAMERGSFDGKNGAPEGGGPQGEPHSTGAL